MKPGYKQTEVGVIPEEWEVKTIDQVSFVTSGKRLPLGSSLVARTTPHPYVRVTDMRPGTVELSEIKYVPEEVFPAIKRYRIYCEDIFISVAGSLGIVGKVPKELHGANLTENADRITSITCSQDFLLYVLASPLIQNTIDSIQTVGAQPKLALTRIRKFEIPHPPLPEQRAIATALSDMDGLLGALDRLIAKQRDLKQAAMQQLLTGQTRLPGFNGEWVVKRLGDVLTICHGRSQHEVETENGAYPILATGGQIGTAKRFLYDKPSVLIGRKGTIDKPQYMDTPFWTVDTLFYSAIRDDNDAKFLFYCFCLIDWKQHNEASGVPSLNARTIENIVVSCPDAAEQTAIASVLSEMDLELAALEQRREKTRALKQGMMQELLTGRTRLVSKATPEVKP
jgi:type I restriction enzyme S subunit